MAEGSFALALLGMAETMRISFPTVIESVIGRGATREVCNGRLDAWSRRLLDEARITLRVSGREAVPRDEYFVVMSNHQSLYDIPVLFQSVPPTLRMVAKSDLFRVPVWGAAMLAAEFISLDRDDKERSREGLRVARERIRSGINVWIAPEGTRSPSGKLGRFKGGGFKLAFDTGTRILPVTIDGTRNVLAAKGRHVRRGKHVEVTIHAPIDPQAYGDRREELSLAVRTSIESSLPPEHRG